MVKALFDTNIVIDYLNGVPQAKTELERYDQKSISIITSMEVLVGAPEDAVEDTRSFLATFSIIALDDAVAAKAVEFRRKHRIKLPDAVIWASADIQSSLLVTRNTKDFPPDMPGIRAPYVL